MEENKLKKEIDDMKLEGMALVKDLKISCDRVPEKPGIYVVLGHYSDMPDFLEKGTGPTFHIKKGKSPQPMNYPVNKLEGKWVEDTWILYIGKTDRTLQKRITEYIRFGQGKDVPHRGGRSIWQLPDSDNLIIGWRVIDGPSFAGKAEQDLLTDFKNKHNNQLPFANLRE